MCLRIFVRVNNMRQHLLAQNNCKCMGGGQNNSKSTQKSETKPLIEI